MNCKCKVLIKQETVIRKNGKKRVGMVFLAYQGFGLITNAAEDMKNPEKTFREPCT
jgi:L-asparagine transporter-like permease